jgi:hypothetical protein
MTAMNPSGKHKPWASLHTVLVGIGICGLIGPALPLFVMIPMDAFQDRSVHDLLNTIVVFPYVWLYAVLIMGPAGAVLGALGALWIRFRSRNLNPKLLLLESIIVGLVLGTSVPLPMSLLFGPKPGLDLLKTSVFMGTPSGIVCAVLVFLAMSRLGLLSERRD